VGFLARPILRSCPLVHLSLSRALSRRPPVPAALMDHVWGDPLKRDYRSETLVQGPRLAREACCSPSFTIREKFPTFSLGQRDLRGSHCGEVSQFGTTFRKMPAGRGVESGVRRCRRVSLRFPTVQFVGVKVCVLHRARNVSDFYFCYGRHPIHLTWILFYGPSELVPLCLEKPLAFRTGFSPQTMLCLFLHAKQDPVEISAWGLP